MDALSGDVEEAVPPGLVQRERHHRMILLDDLMVQKVIEIVTKDGRKDRIVRFWLTFKKHVNHSCTESTVEEDG